MLIVQSKINNIDTQYRPTYLLST